MALDDIEDMIGEDEVDRAVVAILRAPIVAPKTQLHRPPRAAEQPRASVGRLDVDVGGDAADAAVAVDVPGTQLIW